MKRKSLILISLGGFLLLACGIYWPVSMSPRGMGPVSYRNYTTNGERIYFTATNEQGEYISYTGGPAYSGMMGGQLACVSCHGEDGQGGFHYMHMQTMDAPPINYDALVQMMVEESGGTPQPGGYTLDDFRKSVVDGQHPDGDELDQDMPRWQMSDQDLSDLLEFIKTLP